MKKRLVFTSLFVGLLVLAVIPACSTIVRGVSSAVAPSAITHLKCPRGKGLKPVVLSIDDGLDPQTTGKIVDVLGANNATATFFVVGEYIESQQELLEELIDKGHEIANHAYRDVPSMSLSPLQFEEEFDKTDFLLDQYVYRNWFRPASGRYNKRILAYLQSRDYSLVLADVYSFDHAIDGIDFHLGYISRNVRSGSIVVLHDGFESGRGMQTVNILKLLLPELKERGFQVLSMNEAIETFGCSIKKGPKPPKK